MTMLLENPRDVYTTETFVGDTATGMTFHETEFSPISDDERMVLQVWQTRIVDLADELDVTDRGVPRVLDRIAQRWLEVDGEYDNPRVLLALGSAFGQLLIDQHDFQWARFKEDGLYAWAVRHPATDVTIWPFAFAAQRLMDTDVACFLEMVYFCILDELEERQTTELFE